MHVLYNEISYKLCLRIRHVIKRFVKRAIGIQNQPVRKKVIL